MTSAQSHRLDIGRADRPHQAAAISPSTANPSPATRAIRLPRRWSPMASSWWGARSNTIARAASLTAGSEEPNALVELRTGARREPNTKATTAELYEGLVAASQNRWPSLRHDLLSMNQLASPIFVAGFYYKTFMWPAKFWEAIYEPLIRRAAGLGRAAGISDPDHYEKAWAHCDVLIAGGGPAGLAAALAAGRAGARVILCEEDIRARRSAAQRRRRNRRHARFRLDRPDIGRTRRHARCPHHDADDSDGRL